MPGIKTAAYLKLIFFTYTLMSKSYFVDHFFHRTNLRGFRYSKYGSCYDYHNITVLNNYHMFIMLRTNIFLKTVKGVLAV